MDLYHRKPCHLILALEGRDMWFAHVLSSWLTAFHSNLHVRQETAGCADIYSPTGIKDVSDHMR